MVETIIIKFDNDKKTITGIKRPKNFDIISMAKLLLSIVMQDLHAIQPVKKNNIEIVKPEIIGGK